MRDFNRNKKVYKKYYEGPYKSKYRRGMNKFEFKTVWTLMWLLFIGSLCLMFNSGWPIALLVVWLFGVI